MPLIPYKKYDPLLSMKQFQFILDLAEEREMGHQDILEIATRFRGTLVKDLGELTKAEAGQLISYFKELAKP